MELTYHIAFGIHMLAVLGILGPLITPGKEESQEIKSGNYSCFSYRSHFCDCDGGAVESGLP